MMVGRFALLPHAQTEIAADASRPAGDGQRLSLEYDLEITANGSPQGARVPVRGQLKGPADIISINRSMIARVEPQPGLRGFEPNYFPFIEFVDADFPWRYSLDPGSGDWKKPWIALLALQADEYQVLEQGRGPLPRIRVNEPASSLPDLSQSWACAHVQVRLDGASVDTVMQSHPGAHFARLFCPRKLQERAAYALFLVPAYEAGRLSGLGQPGAVDPFDAPAWDATSSDPVDLPVYFQTRFLTDTLQDLKTLAQRLRGLTDAERAAAGADKMASAARPGYYPDYERPGATFEIQGALRQPDAPIEAFNTDPALLDRMVETLETVIGGETEDDDGEDPLVALPPYGWRFRQQTSVSRARAADDQWFDRVNLDLKFRQVAALGAETVRRNEELFAKKCWEQYEDLFDANQRLTRLQAAQVLVDRVSTRHFRRLPSDVALSLAESVQPYAEVEDGTVIDVIRQVGAPSTFASRGLRRQAAKRPVKFQIQDGRLVTGIPAPAIPGDATRNPVTRPPARPSDGPLAGRSSSVIVAEGLAPQLAAGMRAFLGDRLFAGQKRPRAGAVAVADFRSATLSAAVADMMEILPDAKAEFTIGGRLDEEKTSLNPIYRSPVIPLALFGYLAQFAKDALLSDAAELPENTVAVFQENRHFIEAFLVGANHEMNNELRWREFPTDMRGTIFRRFWGRGFPAADVAGDDIAQIHTWDEALGRHFPPSSSDHEADFVIVIRGEIVRKLGQPIVVLNEAPLPSWKSGQGVDHEPVFFGRIGEDIAFYGFDVPRAHILTPTTRDRTFLVIYEQMGRLRFGLDVATAAVRQERRVHEKLSLRFPVTALARSYETVPAKLPGTGLPPSSSAPEGWDDLSWSHMLMTDAGYINFNQTITIPGQADYWGGGRTSASLARSFWQKPLGVVIPLKRIL